jgi:hypothetical protein
MLRLARSVDTAARCLRAMKIGYVSALPRRAMSVCASFRRSWLIEASSSAVLLSGRWCTGSASASKKSLHAEEATRPDIARKRRWWKRIQSLIEASRLVFIDETWIKTNMAPLRGWCRRGQRLKERVPHGHWITLTFLAALRVDQVTAPGVFDGPINGECFLAYVEQVLVPSLKAG